MKLFLTQVQNYDRHQTDAMVQTTKTSPSISWVNRMTNVLEAQLSKKTVDVSALAVGGLMTAYAIYIIDFFTHSSAIDYEIKTMLTDTPQQSWKAIYIFNFIFSVISLTFIAVTYMKEVFVKNDSKKGTWITGTVIFLSKALAVLIYIASLGGFFFSIYAKVHMSALLRPGNVCVANSTYNVPQPLFYIAILFFLTTELINGTTPSKDAPTSGGKRQAAAYGVSDSVSGAGPAQDS